MEQTGDLNDETIEFMKKESCGVRDFENNVEGLKKGLTRNDVDLTMKKSFNVWEKATNLEFERRSIGYVNIELRFEMRYHGDDDPFDGEGGTLANA